MVSGSVIGQKPFGVLRFDAQRCEVGRRREAALILWLRCAHPIENSSMRCVAERGSATPRGSSHCGALRGSAVRSGA